PISKNKSRTVLYKSAPISLEIGLEWGAALRRSKGISLFDPFKKEPCV
ncbi:helix-turn-helix domain-containing protein, partial [Bacillus sp. SS-TM]